MSSELTITKVDENSYLAKGNYEHYCKIAKMMAASDMVPKGYKDKPADILISMEMGRSLNLAPLYAIQNIAVINGKPCLYGDGMLAVCSGHPEFENINEEPILDADNRIIGYQCSVKRKGRTVVTQCFTIEQAKLASLWGKVGPWKQYPERMLQLRARGFALRDSFADALGGVRMAEEVQDYAEPTDITPRNSPQVRRSAGNELKELLKSNDSTEEERKAIEVDPETGEILPAELQ